jgi:transposase InsO family protein
MPHGNALLTPAGRLKLARAVVEEGWTLAMAAERFSVAVSTVVRWRDRYLSEGAGGMHDRSSRPKRSPYRTPTRVERRVLGLRASRRWGPARIAHHLGLVVSTVHRILTRYRCVPLSWTDPATGAPLRARRRVVNRYEYGAPGGLIHMDIKKLARIPDGGGHRIHGIQGGWKRKKGTRPGWAHLHHAMDDHSRLVYSEILTDERKETVAAFWSRATAYFASVGITIQRLLTDNGSAYRSGYFAQRIGAGITHIRTKPYRPQTNGKVERFNQTLLTEWAYARPYRCEADRAAAYTQFLHTYNHHRPHTALAGAVPADRVPNLSGQHS